MVTTFQIDSLLMEQFREAINNKYGTIRGHIGKEVRSMFEERIKDLNNSSPEC